MERWIQPKVLQSSIAPIPGPNNSKILPDSSHFGPSTRLTTSLPTSVRSALTAMPTKAMIPSELGEIPPEANRVLISAGSSCQGNVVERRSKLAAP